MLPGDRAGLEGMTMTVEEKVAATANALVTSGKGVLAIDETSPTCTKRFAEFGIESTADSRRAYRETLITTPGIGDYVSGVIMFGETIRQTAKDGRSFVDVLDTLGVLPGIKVDTGLAGLAKAPGETVTAGLDGLRERLHEYREIGARFTKWRAVIKIGPGTPSRYCIETNAHALGRYAALAQEAGLTPIVEPEVLSHDRGGLLHDHAHGLSGCGRNGLDRGGRDSAVSAGHVQRVSRFAVFAGRFKASPCGNQFAPISSV